MSNIPPAPNISGGSSTSWGEQVRAESTFLSNQDITRNMRYGKRRTGQHNALANMRTDHN